MSILQYYPHDLDSDCLKFLITYILIDYWTEARLRSWARKLAVTALGMVAGPDRVMVFQEYDQLLPWKTVRGNILFPLRAALRPWSRREAEDKGDRFTDGDGIRYSPECGWRWPRWPSPRPGRS
jgi:hypothetical protein